MVWLVISRVVSYWVFCRKIKMIALRLHLIFLSCLFLLACSSGSSLRNKVKNWDPYQYTVQHGDTLYSIAWRYDLDFKALASWNKIRQPYTIFPGQRINMRGPVTEPENKTYLFGATNKTVRTQQELARIPDYSRPENIPSAPPVNSATDKPGVPPVKDFKTGKKTSKKFNKKHSVQTNQKENTSAVLTKGKITWSWPIKGKLFSTFAANNTDRKGIDIIGQKDQKVRAASSGVVVYSGSGLLSYGNLIIIKHSDRYLSAYAHNKRLLVKEGQRVKRGENVAIVGKKLNVTNLLHFEIRKDGKPVNPLVYLP